MDKIKPYVSDMRHLCGAERYMSLSGKSTGEKLIHMYNGKIRLILKEDKCLDIFRADYMGKNIAYISKNGHVSSKLCNSGAYSFTQGFDGGFLYTCGLENIGAPVESDGKTLIQHGSISYLPAENVNIYSGTDKGKYYVRVSGDINYTALFGSFLTLHREITLFYDSDEIRIKDTLINNGYIEDKYMLLYHFNLGFPLLTENTKTTLPEIEKTHFLSEKAEKNYGRMTEFEKPSPKAEEEVFVHKLKNAKNTVKVAGENASVQFDYDSPHLPYLTEWKSAASGDYALGIEPSSTSLRDKQYAKIHPNEQHEFSFVIKIRNI